MTMENTFNNGKITVTDKSITVKGFLGSTTLSRKEIRSIDHSNGFMNYVGGVINTLTLVNAGTGIKQLGGNPLIVIKMYDDKAHRFIVPKEDYQKFVEAL